MRRAGGRRGALRAGVRPRREAGRREEGPAAPPAAARRRGEADRGPGPRAGARRRRKGSGSGLTGVRRVGLRSLSEVTGAASSAGLRLAGGARFRGPVRRGGGRASENGTKRRVSGGEPSSGGGGVRSPPGSPGMQQVGMLSCGRAAARSLPGERRPGGHGAAAGRRARGPGQPYPGAWPGCWVGFSCTRALSSWGYRAIVTLLVGQKALPRN